MEMHLRQADPDTYRAVLKEIKSKEIYSIVIDTKPSNMQHFLKGVREILHHFVFTDKVIEVNQLTLNA